MKDKVLAWMGSGRVGESSKAMALAVVGAPNNGSHPSDPADFNRCLLLLEAVPDIRKHMGKVSEINETWRKIVSRWDELEKCFIDEVGLDWSKAQKATKTYALMKEIGC